MEQVRPRRGSEGVEDAPPRRASDAKGDVSGGHERRVGRSVRRPRTWVPLDCTFWDDPKIVRAVELAGHEAGAIYQRLVGWAMQNGTQGLIPKRIPHGWTDNPRPILDALTTVGL